jgi:anti-sigma28 factor (negative regulator of flagellin synthesis)
MAHLSTVSGVASNRIEALVRRSSDDHAAVSRSAHRGEDVAEISTSAREAARADAAGFRADLVRRVRQQISEGTYLTSDKLDAVADRILRDLDPLT